MKWVVIILVVVVVGAVGAYWYDGYRAESTLREQPVYRVLKEHERAVYDKIVAEYKILQRDETTREKFINFANNEINLAATQRLAHASQGAVLALVQDMLATARKLQEAPDDTCFRYWFPLISGPPDVAKYIEPQAQAHTLELMGEVIRTAAEAPAPLPDPNDVKENLAKVINETYEQFGADAQMIAHADDPNVDRAKICVITMSVYDRILSLPPADSSALIRSMTQIR